VNASLQAVSTDALTLEDIESAASRLQGVLHPTPLARSETFSRMAGTEIYLKNENFQKTGSYKIRGAYNKVSLLKEAGDVNEVVTASAGNHAQGVAFAASKLGVHAKIVMPRSTPIAKIKATEGYGAEVILRGNCYDEAHQVALQIQEESGAVFIHPFDDPAVIAGQGTVAAEILKDLPNVDIVFVPAGGGGLLSGVAYYLKMINPRIRVIGVQAEGANAIEQSFKARRLITTENTSTIADGIAVRVPGKITTGLIFEYADDVISVSDAEISSAILTLLERCKQLVEPAGAVSLAAALSFPNIVRGKRSVCILSGGNIDVGFINRLIELGLFARGRRLKFAMVLPDVPGSLERVAHLIAKEFANVIRVQYDRIGADLNPQNVILRITCEVSDTEHGQRVIEALQAADYRVTLE
jgi:threonine dehydratase